MDGEHSFGTGWPAAVPDDGAGRSFPSQLGVAFVAGYKDASLPAPVSGGGQVVQLPSRVPGAVDPEHQGPGGIGLTHCVR